MSIDALISLALLDVTFDRFRADVTCGANIVALCPERGTGSPVSTANLLELLSESARGNSFEQPHNLRRCKLGWGRHKQVDVIGHHFNGNDFKPVLCGNFAEQLFKARGNWFNQNLFAIARNPNQVVVDYIDAVRSMFSILIHTKILPRKGKVGFLHPLEAGGFRRPNL